MTRVEGSTQSRVLEAVRAAGEMTVKGLQAALSLPGEKGYARISRAAQDLMKAGYIHRAAPGTYRYAGEPRDIEYCTRQRRMARVIRIRTTRHEPFTARELAELAEVSLDWSQRYISFLVQQGFLETAGVKRVGPSRVKAPVYLASLGRLNDDWPVLRRQRRTAGLDTVAARIREGALTLARDCRASRESLETTAVELDRLALSIRKALAEGSTAVREV